MLCGIVFGVTADLAILGVVGHVARSVLHLADSVLGLTLQLIDSAFCLGVFVAGPLADLALNTALNVFHLSFNAVLIHGTSCSYVRIECWNCLDHCSTAADQLEDQSNDCQNQQNVNETTHRIAAHNTEQPQD